MACAFQIRSGDGWPWQRILDTTRFVDPVNLEPTTLNIACYTDFSPSVTPAAKQIINCVGRPKSTLCAQSTPTITVTVSFDAKESTFSTLSHKDHVATATADAEPTTTMIAFPDPKAALVNAFMAAFKYNDTNHPAVRLVDMYLTDHPEILTYTKYAAGWMLLNVLTVLFTLYMSIKAAIFVARMLWVGSNAIKNRMHRRAESPSRERATATPKDRAVTKLRVKPQLLARMNTSEKEGEMAGRSSEDSPASSTSQVLITPDSSAGEGRAHAKAGFRRKNSKTLIYEWDTSDEEDDF